MNPKKYSLEAFRARTEPEEPPEPIGTPPRRQNWTVGDAIDVPPGMPDTYVIPIESGKGEIGFVFRFQHDAIDYAYPALKLRVVIAMAKTRHGNMGGFFLMLNDAQEQVFYTDIILSDQLLAAHFMDVFSRSGTITCVLVQGNKIVRIYVLAQPDKKSQEAAKQVAERIRDNPVPLDPVCFAEAKADFDRVLGIEVLDDFAKLFH